MLKTRLFYFPTFVLDSVLIIQIYMNFKRRVVASAVPVKLILPK